MPKLRQRPEISNYARFHQPTKELVALVQPNKKASFTDVGGDGDCGFRSIVAAAILDKIYTKERVSANLLNTVLNRHLQCFREHRVFAHGTTPTERMQHLIDNVRQVELIEKMAYTLRQIAVDEFCATPHRYRGAFVQQHERTSPEKMRQPKTWIDESSIYALATRLNMPIEVKLVTRDKTIPLPLLYNASAKENPKIVIQLKDGHYTPRVVSSERFAKVRSQPISNLNATMDEKIADPSISEILALIAAEDARINATFDDTLNRLHSAVVANELNKALLLDMYVKNMPKGDYLKGRVAHIGAELGSQDFNNAIERAHRGASTFVSFHDPMVDHLVHAIARAISIGEISSEVLEQIESPSTHSMSMRRG